MYDKLGDLKAGEQGELAINLHVMTGLGSILSS